MDTKTNGSNMDDQLNQIFSLVVSRSRGEAATEDVENAVSELLTTNAPIKQAPAPVEQCTIHQDTDDYDNLEREPPPTEPLVSNNNETSVNGTMEEATIESMRNDLEEEDGDDPLDRIPLGKAGAKMMVTFGDGPTPKPQAVERALLGARQCLQMAIKDARALRRQQKEEYLKARKVAILSTKQGKLKGGEKIQPNEQSAGTDMMYRAMEGYDKLAYDPKCGFDVEQLRQLFPEEIRAFNRWKEMRNDYQKSSEDTGVETPARANGEEIDSKKVDTDIPVAEGHLEERAAQFDVRTDQMKDDWYLKFSEVRRGSFLPRKAGMKNAEERQWDQKRKKDARGRPKGGNWESMSATSVRFLHWVGFDPRTALPPPTDEVTEALAFLAYDFMGRIVEKVYFLSFA